MSSNAATISLGLIATVVVFYVLAVGKDLLVPLVLAILIWYVLNGLSALYQRIVPGERTPEWLTLIAAMITLGVVAFLLADLIQSNAAQVVAEAPGYQDRIQTLMDKTAALFGVEQAPTIKQMVKALDLGPWVSRFATALTSLIGNIGLIVIYVLFLLMEQNTFMHKLNALFPDQKRQQQAKSMLLQMNREIQTYLGIKTLLSLVTGLLSYLVLRVVGVDYAEFWAVSIFLLNYIPTIGSIIATLFPALLALIQFDTLTPFAIIVVSLTTIQFVIGNLLEPRMMGNTLNISPLVVLLLLALWGSIWGVVGMFLSVPLSVIALIVLSHFTPTRPIAILLSSSGKLKTTGANGSK